MCSASSCDGRPTPLQTTRKVVGRLLGSQPVHFFKTPFYDSCCLMRGRKDANGMQLRELRQSLSLDTKGTDSSAAAGLLLLCTQIHNKILYWSHSHWAFKAKWLVLKCFKQLLLVICMTFRVGSAWWFSQTIQVKITRTTRFNYNDCVSFLAAKIKKSLHVPQQRAFTDINAAALHERSRIESTNEWTGPGDAADLIIMAFIT